MLSTRSNKKWDKKDLKRLGFLYANDVPVDKIRKLLNRTDQSIMGQQDVLNSQNIEA